MLLFVNIQVPSALSISVKDRISITAVRDMSKSRSVSNLEMPLACFAIAAPLTAANFADLS
jgi:hypothetical protein